MQLRPYQDAALHALLSAWRAGARRVLMVAPTGSGKTVCFSTLTRLVQVPTLVLVHRRELLEQASRKLTELGVAHGVIAAGVPARASELVQVASIPTLVRRERPPASLVIVDEAHGSTATTWASILDGYPNARVCGWTATPFRLGGAPLAGAWDALRVVATPAELREAGYLSPYEGFAYRAPDLTGVATVGGDYDEAQTSALMREPALVANVVEMWLAHASHLSTVVFAASVEHSQQLAAEFVAAGVAAEHLDGGAASEARRAILRRVEAGETRVLVNVGICVEGLDIPRLKCCVLARPTKSVARGLQMMGRVRRPWQGQVARIHDHAFVVTRTTGLPDDARDYTLRAKAAPPDSLHTCRLCLAIYSGDVCPACGAEAPPPAGGGRRPLATVDDAERLDFDSLSALPTPRNPVPVEVRWEAGRKVEGIYRGRAQVRVAWGQQWHYRLEGAKRDYVMPGLVDLDRRMAQVPTGAVVRVTCTGERPVPTGRVMKTFSVEVDHG